MAGTLSVEKLKIESAGMRGHLPEALADGTASFDEAGYQLLKFHGIYQGYDRDSATALKQQGLAKETRFMMRVRIPGGRLTAAQYLALDEMAGRWGNGSLRLTTRQSVQFHGMLKGGLKPTIEEIDAALLTTLAACGDVVRTVTTVPAPIRDTVHARLEADARALSRRLLPLDASYHEVWLDGGKVSGESDDELYGRSYLPRKFKIGIAAPEDNSIDVLTNDLAIVARFEGERLEGYDFYLGGGLGMSHGNAKTYPRLASPVAFVEADDLLDAAVAVVKLHRDHGDRGNRKHARLKYVIAEEGEEWARERLSEYLGKTLAPARPIQRFAVVDHLGWHAQGDGKLYLGVPVPAGRVVGPLREAFHEIVSTFGVDPIVTPQQDLILSNVAPADRAAIEAVLREHGVALVESFSPVRRWALACPALPSCGLALTEAERVLDPFLAGIEAQLEAAGIAGERIAIRITGCPNGCARPYSAELGSVGRMPDHYQFWVGGDFAGTRLAFPLLDRVKEAEVAETLGPLFALFAAQRSAGEAFGDFCHRLGKEALLAALPAREPQRKAS
jgi:sulfite reductase (ferredoxin)